MFCHLKAFQQFNDKSHVGKFQDIVPADGVQAFRRQRNHLHNTVWLHSADTLQPHLADFFKGMAFPALPVNIFQIIQLFITFGSGVGIFDDTQGHVGLEGKEPSVQIRKRDHLVASEKVFVFRVQAVFFKFTHFIFFIAVLLIETSELQTCFFIGLQFRLFIFHKPSQSFLYTYNM